MLHQLYQPISAFLNIAHSITKGGVYTLPVRQISLAMLCLGSVSAAEAADIMNGKTSYNTSCASASCHGSNPLTNMNKILRGANNGTLIMSAIYGDKGGMGSLSATVSATQADDIGAYLADPSAAVLPSQTIGTISFLPTTLAVGATATASATATSGLAVSFSSTTPDVCTVSGSVVSGIIPGTCIIAADQAGDTSYSAATQVTQTIDTVASPYNGLWWNENESGWGVTLTQHVSIIFATLFTYDTNGNPIWYVASNCAVTANGCTGDLYQVTGGSAPTTAWNPNLGVTAVGTVDFVFDTISTGNMGYTINGVSGIKAITKQQF